MSSDGPNGIWSVVRTIPRGKVASYGDVGQALERPVSGLIVGRWMANCPVDVPWWRVVARDGSLPIAKKDPVAAQIQVEKLEAEGVRMIELAVDMDAHRYVP